MRSRQWAMTSASVSGWPSRATITACTRSPQRSSGTPMTAHMATWDSWAIDRKSTRLNSSHLVISYAVFCLKKKKKKKNTIQMTTNIYTQHTKLTHYKDQHTTYTAD